MNKHVLSGKLVTTALLSTAILTACNSSSSNNDESYQTTAIISSQPVAQSGAFFTGRAYSVTLENDDAQNFSDVRNFSHEWGYSVTAQVEVVTYAEPLEDGPKNHINVLDVIEMQEDEVGTIYEYEWVLLNSPEIFHPDEEDGYYSFLQYRVLCAENINCDQLASLSDSGGAVAMRFEYLGQSDERLSAIRLTHWN